MTFSMTLPVNFPAPPSFTPATTVLMAIPATLQDISSSCPQFLEIFLLALAWDILLGEPPAAVHPVVLMGRLISALRRRTRPTRVRGAVLALLVISISVAAGHLLMVSADALLPGSGLLVGAYLLKSTFAIRSLLGTSRDIGKAIEDDLDGARTMLPALVSRETGKLTPTLASSAVVESLSENYVDTVITPLFYYVLFAPLGLGVEAALAFKAVSTMDSMLGYKRGDLLYLGFAPARLDDLANWVPARMSILFMAAADPGRAGRTLRAALEYRRATPSPNSGWSMAATAGALGIKMEKPGVYTILPDGRDPHPQDISRALWFVGKAILITTSATALILTALP